jgi:hypothetical protein
MVGNEPFTELVLSDDEGNDWFLSRESRKSLERSQHQELTLRGEAEYREIFLADGRSLGIRRYLWKAEIAEEAGD